MLKIFQEKSYEDYRLSIKIQLARALELRKIQLQELMAILFIFDKTTNTEELEGFLDIFADTFPILKSIQLENKEEKQTTLEERVKKAVGLILTRDPLRATQLAKDALNKEIPFAALLKKYPELSDESF